MTYFDDCKKENGTINHNGVEHALMSNAQFDSRGTEGYVAFFATGFSKEQLAKAGNDDIDPMFDEYAEIEWDCSEWLKSGDDDQSNACDWSNPKSVDIINQ